MIVAEAGAPTIDPGNCPKCGHADIALAYCTARHAADFQRITAGPTTEHLDARCVRCHFRWRLEILAGADEATRISKTDVEARVAGIHVTNAQAAATAFRAQAAKAMDDAVRLLNERNELSAALAYLLQHCDTCVPTGPPPRLRQAAAKARAIQARYPVPTPPGEGDTVEERHPGDSVAAFEAVRLLAERNALSEALAALTEACGRAAEVIPEYLVTAAAAGTVVQLRYPVIASAYPPEQR